MKLTKTTATTITVIGVSLITTGVVVCWGGAANCRSLFSPRNCLAQHMKRMDPSFGGENLEKAPENGETKACLAAKREVFVDGRRLYWGNLGELTKPERFFAPRSPIQTAATENPLSQKSEALQQFTQELRAALKAFEKRYCLKIHWRKKDPKVPDVTTQFINFWDKGFGQEKGGDAEEKTDTEGKGK